MKKNKIFIFFFVISFLVTTSIFAKENIPLVKKSVESQSKAVLAGGCLPTTSQTDLDINNVRTTILTGGDMWWDLISAQYEIPKNSGKHSLFAGALWIGGIDAGGKLKVAAMTYRQNGNDFWSGPLNTSTASITSESCAKYDRHWIVTRDQVEDFIEAYNNNNDDFDVPTDIYEWPGNGDATKGEDPFLAPFYDQNSDGRYDTEDGDFPAYKINDIGNEGKIFGDKTLWWVFNDKGNIHSETKGEPIGLEIRAQAFAFSTNDEINNMTFYNYEIINRSSFAVNKTYFGQWVDPDLGKYDDDYVGCDVARGLGYCYNGDAEDEGVKGYGLNPPSVGVDFFQGPIADLNDGIDNDRDGEIDEVGEQIIMSKFVYYNNDFTPLGNPEKADHYYQYLKGIWKDNLTITYGENGRNPSYPDCDFMFPGESDPTGWGTNKVLQSPWDEASVGNVPADRRFLQSAGPFTLQPGAVNYITTGVVWASSSQGGNTGSLDLLKLADDKAQILFNNNFNILDGPDLPDVQIVELDKELIINLLNTKETEDYVGISKDENDNDIIYSFQGYQIFQLKDETASATDIQDPDKARLVAQVDIKDDISKIVNSYFDPKVSAYYSVEMVNGENKGIKHSFRITEDLFALGNTKLVNHKKYFYTVIPYANTRMNVKELYLQGRKTEQYIGIPHIISSQDYGTKILSEYGKGPEITRIEGQGNGGMNLDLTDATIDSILKYSYSYELTYKKGYGPINIKVVDPLSINGGDFNVKLYKDAGVYKWKIDKVSGDSIIESVYSESSINVSNDQIISQWGISIQIDSVVNMDYIDTTTVRNDCKNEGYPILESEFEYADDDLTKHWITFIADDNSSYVKDEGTYYSPLDWIRSGKEKGIDIGVNCGPLENQPNQPPCYDPLDLKESFETILNGTWAPYKLCAKSTSKEYNDHSNMYTAYPAGYHDIFVKNMSLLDDLSSVYIVFTSDKSKWTRSAVLEMCEEPSFSEGGASKFDIRKGQSVDKNGNPDGTGTGMGWFPGYAINMETGERLNIMFGEDSRLIDENGRDMLWNPTSNFFSDLGTILCGGKHYIYVVAHTKKIGYEINRYDEGAQIENIFKGSSANKEKLFASIMWVSMPMASSTRNNIKDPSNIPSDFRIKIRVAKPYAQYSWLSGSVTTPKNDNYPMYKFNLDDIKTITNDTQTAKDALNLINVVPNPYYAYSSYETDQLDNRVKITNLPKKCTVSIYTLNGTLVRQFIVDKTGATTDRMITKDLDDTFSQFQRTSIDWDLKNTYGVPVLSGIYLIHVNAPGIGEKVVKWFGSMRPIDLDSF